MVQEKFVSQLELKFASCSRKISFLIERKIVLLRNWHYSIWAFQSLKTTNSNETNDFFVFLSVGMATRKWIFDIKLTIFIKLVFNNEKKNKFTINTWIEWIQSIESYFIQNTLMYLLHQLIALCVVHIRITYYQISLSIQFTLCINKDKKDIIYRIY